MKILYSSSQASKYAKFIEESYSWKYLEKPIFVKHLKPFIKEGTRSLDAGCGTGYSTKLLLDLGIRPENILGVDISSHMLEFARKTYPKVKFQQVDLPNLKLKDKSLDLVISNMVLQYLNQEDFKTTMQNISKWLVKGGKLLYIVVHPLRFASNYSEYFSNKVKKEITPWGTKIDYYPKKVSDYINVTINSGFIITSVEEPAPTSKEAKSHTEGYEKYSSIPTRLAVVAIKK